MSFGGPKMMKKFEKTLNKTETNATEIKMQ